MVDNNFKNHYIGFCGPYRVAEASNALVPYPQTTKQSLLTNLNFVFIQLASLSGNQNFF